MPVQQPPRRQLVDENAAELGEHVPPHHAFNDLGAFAAATFVVHDIVGERVGDGVAASVPASGGAPFLIAPPCPRRTLGLAEIEDADAVRVLQIVGKPELLLVVSGVAVAPARDPGAASGATA